MNERRLVTAVLVTTNHKCVSERERGEIEREGEGEIEGKERGSWHAYFCSRQNGVETTLAKSAASPFSGTSRRCGRRK